jgi:hypothetical protein
VLEIRRCRIIYNFVWELLHCISFSSSLTFPVPRYRIAHTTQCGQQFLGDADISRIPSRTSLIFSSHEVRSRTHSPTHPLTHSLTHLLTYLLTHSPTHSLAQSLSQSVNHRGSYPKRLFRHIFCLTQRLKSIQASTPKIPNTPGFSSIPTTYFLTFPARSDRWSHSSTSAFRLRWHLFWPKPKL